MDRDKFDAMMAPMAPKPYDGPSVPGAVPDGEPVRTEGFQVGFDVVEVQRLNLQAGDVLMVTVKNDDLNQASVDALRRQLELVFQNNKVFVFAMGTNDDVQLSVVSQSENPVASSSPVGYCSDCTCGKKEQAIGDSNAEQLSPRENDQQSDQNGEGRA